MNFSFLKVVGPVRIEKSIKSENWPPKMVYGSALLKKGWALFMIQNVFHLKKTTNNSFLDKWGMLAEQNPASNTAGTNTEFGLNKFSKRAQIHVRIAMGGATDLVEPPNSFLHSFRQFLGQI